MQDLIVGSRRIIVGSGRNPGGGRRLLDVDRNGEAYGSGPPGAETAERGVDGFWDPVGREDEVRFVGDSLQDPLLGPQFVGVAPGPPDVIGDDVGSDTQHGDRVGVGLGDRGRGVGHSRPPRLPGTLPAAL